MKEVSHYISTNIEDRCQGVCHIMVSDLGLYQCFDCRVIFSIRNRGHRLYITQCLEHQYGDLWTEYFKQLKRTKRLVLSGNLAQLHIYRHSYEKSGSKSKERVFFEVVV